MAAIDARAASVSLAVNHGDRIMFVDKPHVGRILAREFVERKGGLRTIRALEIRKLNQRDLGRGRTFDGAPSMRILTASSSVFRWFSASAAARI